MTSAPRGEGGFKNCPILRTNSTDRLREMRTRGRGVSKIPKILRTSYVHGPKDIGDRAKELSQMVKEKVEGERTRGDDGPAAATRVWRNPYRYTVVQHDITREWNL